MIPSLVIFDCDGVLVDTEHLSNAVLAALITESGWPMTPEESGRMFIGWRMPDVMPVVERNVGKALPDDWVKQFEKRRDIAFSRGVEAIPGVAAVMDVVVAQRLNYCVASSGSVAKMQNTLTLSGLKRYFPDDVLFSARDLERGKPFPDIFLHAAAQMGISAEACVVVEDSPAGAKGANAAGMRCFGYAATTDSGLLAAAGATCFTDMAALPGLLGLKL